MKLLNLPPWLPTEIGFIRTVRDVSIELIELNAVWWLLIKSENTDNEKDTTSLCPSFSMTTRRQRRNCTPLESLSLFFCRCPKDDKLSTCSIWQ